MTTIALPYSERIESITWTAVAGQQCFFLPWDVYVRDEDIVGVTLNGVPQAFGPDYGSMVRQFTQTWPQASTADVRRGIVLNDPASAGDVVVIRFAVRQLLMAPPQPLPVRAPGGVLPAPIAGSGIQFGYLVTNLAQALMFSNRQGLQVEIWRRSKMNGRSRVSKFIPGPGAQIRAGRHWSPWWRAPVASANGVLFTDPLTDGWVTSSIVRKTVYKAAYYDPASGARTLLSDATILTNTNTVGDRVSGGGNHPQFAIWIGR